jgi:hypothetical protein
VHQHRSLAEAAGHKEVGNIFYSSCSPDADTGYPDKV